MRTNLYERVASYLRSAPTPSVPLASIYGALVAEVGPGVGSYSYVRAELVRRADLFVVLEPRQPFGEGGHWSGALRSEYELAMTQAGGEPGVRVALAASSTPAPPHPYHRRFAPGAAAGAAGRGPRPEPLMLHQLDASIVELWRLGRDDPMLRADLAEAISQTEEIRRVLSSGT